MEFIEERQKQLQRIKDINTKLSLTSPLPCYKCGVVAVTLKCTPAPSYAKEPIISALCGNCGISSKRYCVSYCYNKNTGRFEHRDIKAALQLAIYEIHGSGTPTETIYNEIKALTAP